MTSGWAPLAGLRVVEALPGGVATRYCGHLLARLGAEVVQVGDSSMDDTRLGFAGNAGIDYGRWLDDGKRRATSADHHADDRVDLVIAGQDADAVATGEGLCTRSSGGAVLVAVTWFDPTGPYGAWAATDEIIHSLTGVAYAFGPTEGPPTLPQGHAPQVMAGTNAANAAMAVLLAPAERRPQRIEVNVWESALCLSEVAAVGAIDDPSQFATRFGVNRYSPTYPCSSYESADGWVGITCLTPPQWRAMCEAIGRPELAGEHRYSTSFRRLLRGDEVDAALAPAIRGRTTEEWVSIGVERRIPIAPMLRPAELLHHPHWRERGSFGPVAESSTLGPTLPFRSTTDGHAEGPGSPDATHGPLSGLRVLDFSMGWSGPQAARFLADLGADVVKVESPSHPDWYRGWETDRGGDPPATEIRASFNTLNRNKRGVALELTTPDGLASARQLIAAADVVIENFALGVIDKLGIGVREQLRLRPGLVTLSMPAFGNGGPLSGVRAYGSTVEQTSGLPFVNGQEGWPPSLQHVAYGDAIAGLYAVTAVLAGLSARPRDGGAALDLAQVACLFEVAADAIIAEQVSGRPLSRTGSERARLRVCGVVATGGGDDDWLTVATSSPGAPSLEDLATWAASQTTAADAAAQLQARGIAAAPVLPVHALGTDPHLVATGFWEELDRRHVGRHTLGAPALRLDGDRPVARRPAPILGEDTDEVLGDERWRSSPA